MSYMREANKAVDDVILAILGNAVDACDAENGCDGCCIRAECCSYWDNIMEHHCCLVRVPEHLRELAAFRQRAREKKPEITWMKTTAIPQTNPALRG